jgi:FkbM family methyltransferase
MEAGLVNIRDSSNLNFSTGKKNTFNMNTFKENLRKKIEDCLYVKLGATNHDEVRFGRYNPKQEPPLKRMKNAIKRLLQYKKPLIADSYLSGINKYEDRLQRIFNHLNDRDGSLLIDLIAFRILGAERVKLQRHNAAYRAAMETAQNLQVGNESHNPHYRHFILHKFNLNPIGSDVQLLFTASGIATDFIIEQYAYKENETSVISANTGDYVIDAGGCWGDTALYFADKVGPTGKVFSFEFIPDNMKLFNTNINFNPKHKERIQLIQNPVSNTSDQKMYYKDDGPASRIELLPFAEQTGTTTTLSIDDFVSRNNIQKIDFIKMDIEGAEPIALQGAIETIKKFKPKLAIAIYHSIEDIANIPNWILDLGLDYEIFLDHFTIHLEETVIFARVKNSGHSSL